MTVLFWRQTVRCEQMAPERLEFFAIFQADQMVRLDRSADRHCWNWLRFLNRAFLTDFSKCLMHSEDEGGYVSCRDSIITEVCRNNLCSVGQQFVARG